MANNLYNQQQALGSTTGLTGQPGQIYVTGGAYDSTVYQYSNSSETVLYFQQLENRMERIEKILEELLAEKLALKKLKK